LNQISHHGPSYKEEIRKQHLKPQVDQHYHNKIVLKKNTDMNEFSPIHYQTNMSK